MLPRRRWNEQWTEIRFCSRACRSRGINATDRALERAILDLLDRRAQGATICPSEAARSVSTDANWRVLMEFARRAARRLSHSGRTQILQKGKVVDPAEFRGPIRIRKTPWEHRAR